ncbi:cell cycle checkpoint control protein RAD9A [Brienomyrus brachyistius]|uniref:cell cycle checkpoint control protein RAD9A n=1 Tax=Brienomyrus brachyistius TaxID=42636 RepID=UPI0020B381B8|nr:cell cycle checkpoint control protein RAD9A [Brienomyrus brachyistius]XP_048826594.1 cell cycle checkpoint control protein RAD9A [Brienomyrus brachyistius]XP_048826595.1 cell cycle checkpoint control protein RAD9A [Brienomyrus brachyistius]XP_048826596.1 cell cycle checkpoint control protein RAD9A [Brienomyrus brachyistius]XP_048826597.1 cell cycle checkpoint control protein RAD9A [Brienomyrus brachyistius]XP_048826598.1 cell cycle checkpoint control protein RAD9A [Brienomyrus brachyistius]
MDCILIGSNVKVLAKAVQSLSKLGEELYLEPQENGLALRTVNSSRSAYACFLFSPLFFQKYTPPKSSTQRCKMVIKSVQAVFKSLSSLEKTVEKCHIELDIEKSRLTFTLHCKHGLLKTHNLSFQDSESLQAVFDKESCANALTAQPKLLVDTVLHFPPSLEEVRVSVNDERVLFRNHVEDEAEQSRAMMTELCLSAEEFDRFAVNMHTCITFCLKELRGLLVFAESSGLPVSMYFDEPGRPLVFSLTDDSVLEVNFVLATLSEEGQPRNHNSDMRRVSEPPITDDFMNDDIDYIIAMETSELAGDSDWPEPPRHAVTPPQLHVADGDQHESRGERADEDGRQGEEETTVEESGRPPNKKFRSLFFGSVLPTPSQTSNRTLQSQEILASDSEDEDSPPAP